MNFEVPSFLYMVHFQSFIITLKILEYLNDKILVNHCGWKRGQGITRTRICQVPDWAVEKGLIFFFFLASHLAF